MKAVTQDEVLARVRQLPSLSAVIVDILASMKREDIDTAALIAKIGQDQGLAARVLRVANSAFYGLSSRVSAISEAVVVLGFHAVRSLVLAASVVDLFPQTGAARFDRFALWRHGIGTAVAARVLAAKLGKDAETAFTAGLLHDIGKIVIYAYFPDIFNAVLDKRAQDGTTMVEAERALLGFDHAAIAYEVARQWRFPPAIQQAMRDHHRPDVDAAFLTDVVHVANVICIALDIGDSGDDRVPPLSAAAWQRLGLSWEALPACLAEIARLNAGMNLVMAD